MYLGIDLGGTTIKVGLVDDSYKLVNSLSIATGAHRKDYEIVKDMASACHKIIKDNGMSLSDFKWIGVGSPGTPNTAKGTIVYANNLPFNNTPVRDIMMETLNIPVIINNDANCAALGEVYAGAAKGVDDAVVITLGTGVGGGIIINKKIYAGFNDGGAELGHTLLVFEGDLCTCGRRGCVEAYVSATGLARQTRHYAIDNPSSLINVLCEGDMSKIGGRTAFDAMRQGDKVGKEVVDLYCRQLGALIANIINAFAPEVVLVGGGIGKEGETLLKPVREYVASVTYIRTEKQTRIASAQLGNDAGIIGAALLGLQNQSA